VLWAASLLEVARRPLLGYGFMAFWGGRTGDYVDVWRLAGWAAPNSHNAFLDASLDLGVVGFLLLLWVCISTCRSAFALHHERALPSATQVWPALFTTFVLLAYLTEGQLLQNNAYWMLFTAAAVTARRHTTPRAVAPSASPASADA
jgi:O-antigen ligase